MNAKDDAASDADIAIRRLKAQRHEGFRVASEAVDGSGRILDRYSAYHEDLVPGVTWNAVPQAATYALIVEDPDAPTAMPFVHWVLWNIPGTTAAVPPRLPRTARTDALPGATQGLNSGGLPGWYGAKPPPGDGLHHYHFQLFALKGRIDGLDPDATLESVVSALKGQILAATELVGTYERAR